MKNSEDDNTAVAHLQENRGAGGNVREEMKILNGEERKITPVEKASVAFGYLNIAIATCVISFCLYIFISTQTDDFGRYMMPWYQPSNDQALVHALLAGLGLAIIMILSIVFLGMSIALIVGVLRKRPALLNSFIVYITLLLPVYIIINMLYFIMIGLYNKYGKNAVYPQIGLLLFNVLFGIEMLIVGKAQRNMKTVNSYNPTRLEEFEEGL